MNKPKLVVITSYPTNGSIFGKNISGLASFAKNTVNSIKDDYDITVLAETHNDEDNYEENGVSVKRIWKKNSKLISFKLLSEILKFNKLETKVIVEFELATFGSNFTTGLTAIFFLFARMFGYNVTTVMHQVITDVNTLSTHLGLKEGSMKTSVINFLLNNLTRFIVRNSNKVIVLDEIHKENLAKITSLENVYVIAHGVEVKELTVKATPHSSINLYYFGHITWYKGADWLIKSYLEFAKQFPEESKRINIQLGGGMSPTQRDNPSYIQYYNDLIELAKRSVSIEITGYVEENDIEKLFANADIQILPYRALMSSSGPLSHAFEYEKPVFISNIISPYLKTKDIKDAMSEFNISESDLVFNLENPIELFQKILRMSDDEKLRLSNFSKEIKERRSWENIGKEYLKVLSS
jgi:glycosyltransferase involved in cell wall biosynthesis